MKSEAEYMISGDRRTSGSISIVGTLQKYNDDRYHFLTMVCVPVVYEKCI